MKIMKTIKMKKFLLMSIVIMLYALQNSVHSEIVYTGPTDILLVPDSIELSYLNSLFSISIHKNNDRDTLDKFVITGKRHHVKIPLETLKKIVSPNLSNIELYKTYDKDSYQIIMPFYFYSKDGSNPSDDVYSLNDNNMIIEFDPNECKIQIRLENGESSSFSCE